MQDVLNFLVQIYLCKKTHQLHIETPLQAIIVIISIDIDSFCEEQEWKQDQHIKQSSKICYAMS